MSPADVNAKLDDGVIVLDMRTPRPFAKEHVPGAVNLQFNRADLADRAEMLLPTDRTYIVHAEPEPIARMAAQILKDAGFDVAGHLEGGLAAWKKEGLPTATLEVMSVDDLNAQVDALQVVDVREGFEYRHAHIPGAVNLPWTESWQRAGELPADRPLAIVCGDEVRSAAAASVLLREGHAPRLVLGGMIDWLEREYPTEKTARA